LSLYGRQTKGARRAGCRLAAATGDGPLMRREAAMWDSWMGGASERRGWGARAAITGGASGAHAAPKCIPSHASMSHQPLGHGGWLPHHTLWCWCWCCVARDPTVCPVASAPERSAAARVVPPAFWRRLPPPLARAAPSARARGAGAPLTACRGGRGARRAPTDTLWLPARTNASLCYARLLFCSWRHCFPALCREADGVERRGARPEGAARRRTSALSPPIPRRSRRPRSRPPYSRPGLPPALC
jgi:hypothetical protein